MANPLIAQGTLNRLRASVIIPSFPSLNVTPPYMGKQMVNVAIDGNFNALIPTATGGVTSPEPYVMVTVSFGLLRTQSLSEQWRIQSESITDLGDISVFSDTTTYGPYDFKTCIISHIDPGAYDGADPVVRVTIQGIYNINNNLWTL